MRFYGEGSSRDGEKLFAELVMVVIGVMQLHI